MEQIEYICWHKLGSYIGTNCALASFPIFRVYGSEFEAGRNNRGVWNAVRKIGNLSARPVYGSLLSPNYLIPQLVYLSYGPYTRIKELESIDVLTLKKYPVLYKFTQCNVPTHNTTNMPIIISNIMLATNTYFCCMRVCVDQVF